MTPFAVYDLSNPRVETESVRDDAARHTFGARKGVGGFNNHLFRSVELWRIPAQPTTGESKKESEVCHVTPDESRNATDCMTLELMKANRGSATDTPTAREQDKGDSHEVNANDSAPVLVYRPARALFPSCDPPVS